MDRIKRNAPKVLSLLLALTIICSLTATTAYTAGAESSGAKTVSDKDNKLFKTETVYVIADSQGEPNKVIVSDWIKNTGKLDKIEDKSTLSDIKNLKGDEKYTLNEDNMCIWDAKGNDIYYQGTSKKDLPVDLSVSYRLDGEAISPKELVTVNNGKVINDGNRTIVAGFATPGLEEDLALESEEINFPNYVEISADVKDFELTTTMTLATNDVFNDIDFSKADKKIDELDKKLDKLTDATDKLIDGSSKLYGGISTLLNKSGTLISGVKTLVKGAKQLQSGASTLDKGAGKLDSATGKLKKGTNTLSLGMSTLQSGIVQLATGLGTLSKNSSTLNSGAKQVFESLLATADAQIAAAGIKADKLTIENYSKVLSGIEDSLSDDSVYKLAYNTALETVTNTVKAQESLIKSQVEAAVKQQVLDGVLKQSGLGMSVDEYNQALAAGKIDDEVKAQIEGAVEQQMNSDDIKSTINTKTEQQIKSLIDENMNSDSVKKQISDAVEKGKSGAGAISALKKQLNSYNEFYKGVLSYTSGVDSVKSGADKLNTGSKQIVKGSKDLKSGAKAMKKGTSALKKGTKTLSDGTKKLVLGVEKLDMGTGVLKSGVKKLKDGSLSLNSGLKTYKEQGVKVLVKAVDGDVKGLVNRLKAISAVSKRYKSFSGLGNGMDGKVDFIYKTDSVKK